MIRRKARLSNTMLSDRETKMILWLESLVWLNECKLSLTKSKLLKQDVLWDYTLKCLVHKGRIKDLSVYRTKVFLEVVLPPLASTSNIDPKIGE